MKYKISVRLVAVIAFLVFAAVAVPLVSAGMASAAGQQSGQATARLAAPVLATTPSDIETAFENVFSQVNPSVVKIDVVMNGATAGASNRNGRGFQFGPPAQAPSQEALGSGFVWDTQGNIVTNNHVVAGASEISVTFADGTIVPAKLVGTDPDSDLAVIKVDVAAGDLHPVQVADSTQLKVGQMAIAIGNPYGEQNTMTTGIVSALGRSLPAGGDSSQGQALSQAPAYTIPDAIQTDAPINPGNSGGVLLNMDGQLIGVTNSIESQSGSSAGIGFAIPSGIVKQVVPALIKSGHYDHAYLGISGTTLTPSLAQAMGLQAGQRGALVAAVTQNGPAAKAGVLGSTKNATVNGAQVTVGGDVIVAIDGQTVKSFDDVVAYLARSVQVNQTVKLTVLRGGSQTDISVTVTVRPTSS